MFVSILKVHYFLWFGALSGIMPFVSIFAKKHSLASAEDVGLLFFVLPFIVSVVKPLFCSIADRNKSHKKVLLISCVTTILSYGLLLTVMFIKVGSISWYWFCLLVLLANCGQGIVISLNDYLVMKEVTELKKSYGGYRVWGTIGWGGFGVIAGVINDNITQLPYLLPGLLMFIVIEGIDIFCMIFKLKISIKGSDDNSVTAETLIPKRQPISVILKKPFISTSKSLKQIIGIFTRNPSLIQYIIVVLVFGSLTAFHWNYYFWYLETIRGQDQLLFGLVLFVESFLGELPIFMISDVIIRKCGPSMSLNISLLAFAVRYFIYGYVFTHGSTYWDILLVEIVQGLTFSLFYTAMTGLAQHYANEELKRSNSGVGYSTNKEAVDTIDTIQIEPQISGNKNSEHNSFATLQGIMSGAFEGVGLGIGALIGGYVIERINIFYIWKVGAFLSCGTIVFNLSADLLRFLINKFCR